MVSFFIVVPCVLFLIFKNLEAVELVEFDPSEIEELDSGIRRATAPPSRRRDSAVELVSFTEEEEAALRQGWEGARSFQKNRAATVRRVRISPQRYCAHYRANYAYYCIGSTYGSEPLVLKLATFCPIYKSKCLIHAKAVESDPFHVLQHRVSPDFPDVEGKAKSLYEEQREEQMRALHPCTKDCNVRIFRHCTQECKCDYEYPRVQRFCNPPPIPFFLNTCRLWYYGCPKYQQYNYASQFIYSKADKGKTVGGVSPRIGSYGGATATGFGGGGGMFSSQSGVSTPFGGFGMGTSIG